MIIFIHNMILYDNVRPITRSSERRSEHRETTPPVEPLHLPDIAAGKAVIMTQVLQALDTAKTRPRIITINGYAGSGKTYLSEEIRQALAARGVHSIFLETDVYDWNQDATDYDYRKDDYVRQKRAWEASQDFEYKNTVTNQREIVHAPLDVIIIGGIRADKNDLEVDSDADVFINNSFLQRLASKGLRDCIIYADQPQQALEVFMDEICGQSDNDLLEHMFVQENELHRFKKAASIVVENERAQPEATISFHDGKIRFDATYKGQRYHIERDISLERMQLIRSIVTVNDPIAAKIFDQDIKNQIQSRERRDLVEIQRDLAA